jgi:pimeloyl-ACP methyl ester carboxylesterase
MKRIILAFCILLIAVTSAAADSQDFVGVLNDAPYKIRVPDNWNGVLLLHAHMYYVYPESYIQAEAAHGGVQAEDFLLSHGYALAGSTFRGTGWQVKEGTEDLIALSRLFDSLVKKPKKRILMGYSMGSLIALKSAEEVPLYDGVIPMCSLAGSVPVNERDGGFAYAYDAAFGWPADWGTWYDARDGLSVLYDIDVYNHFLGQLMDPSNIGKFEFIRLLFDLPLYGFYPLPPPEQYPAGQVPTMSQLMFAITDARADIEARAGGASYGNAGLKYSLTPEEKAYLASLGVNADQLLYQMNSNATISLAKPQKQYMEKYFDPTGDLLMPVLSVHSKNDHLYPAHFETRLLDKVQSEDGEDLLLQVYTEEFGHCTFTPEQQLAAVVAMEEWLHKGRKPKSEFLKGLGFDPDYVPPEWPIGKKHERPFGKK